MAFYLQYCAYISLKENADGIYNFEGLFHYVAAPDLYWNLLFLFHE